MDLMDMNVKTMKSKAARIDANATHLWAAEDNYPGSVQASGALCSKRVKEP
jgi:hypothetical protein